MANEERSILLKVELDPSQLKKQAKEAQEALAALQPELEQIRKEQGKNSVEYAKATELQKQYIRQLRENAKALNALEDQEKKETGSLQQMRTALEAAKVQYKQLSAEQRNSEGGKKMVQGMLEMKNIINEVEASFGTFTGKVGNYEGAAKTLRQQLREVVQEMQAMHAAGKEDSEQFKELSLKAGQLRDSMDAVNEQVKTLATGTKLEANLNVMKGAFDGVVGGAQAAEGAMQLFGSENEDVAKGIQRMVAFQSISNGVNEIYNSLKKEGAVVTALFNASTNAQNATMAVSNKLFGEGTKAAKGFSKALMITGIGALLAGLGLLIANYDKIKASLFGVNEAQEALNATVEDYRSGAKDAATKTNEVKAAFAAAEKGVISKEQALFKYNQELGDAFGKATNLNEAEAIFAKKTPAYIKAAGQRAQATALFAKSAELQAEKLTLSMDNQVGFMDQWAASWGQQLDIISGDSENFNKTQKKLQDKAVAEREKELDKKINIINTEAEKLFIQAEQLEEANGIKSEDDKAYTDEMKRLSDERKKKREEEVKAAEEVAKRIRELTLGNLDLSLSNERKAMEAHYAFLQTIAGDNTDEQARIASEKEQAISAIEEKEKTAAIARITERYDAEVIEAKKNAELVSQLTSQKEQEISAIEVQFATDRAQRQIERITAEQAAADERVKIEAEAAEAVKLLQAELNLETARGSAVEFKAWRELQQARMNQLEADRDTHLKDVTLTASQRKQIEIETELQIRAIKEESFAHEKQLNQQRKQELIGMATSALSSAQSLADSLMQIQQNQIQEELNSVAQKYDAQSQLLQDQLDANIISQVEYDAQKSALDAENAAKEKKLKKEAFEKQKTAQLINAGINTAVGITSALAAPPPASFVLAALAAALGAAQIAVIASQPTPIFAKGGQPLKEGVFGGKPHSKGGTKGVFEDGTRLEVEEGEAFFVLKKTATDKIGQLSMHNQKYGGVPLMADGGAMFGSTLKLAAGGAFQSQVGRSVVDRYEAQNNILQIVSAMPPVITDVKDVVRETQKRVVLVDNANW